MRARKGPLQLFQLIGGERGAISTLLPRPCIVTATNAATAARAASTTTARTAQATFPARVGAVHPAHVHLGLPGHGTLLTIVVVVAAVLGL